MDMLSTKISGLAINTEYSFYLILKTSGGTYSSNTLTVKTHEMTNLTGITVTPGVLPQGQRDALEATIERIDAKLADTVRIDTTHFVCTEPRGTEWSKAVEMNIPVVRPEWVDGCEREGKIVGVRGYYLDADPKLRQVGTNPAIQQQSRESMSHKPAASPPVRTSSIPQNQAQTPPTQSQSNLPSRGAPKSPEKERMEGEPGPSVEPTPQIPQGEDWNEKALPPHPHDEEAEEDSDYSNKKEEESEKETGGLPAESSADESEDEVSSKPAEDAAREKQREKEKAIIEDEKGEDMEDVAL